MRAIEAGTTSEKKWTDLIGQQQQSGLSVSAFCRDRGFSDQAFYYWRKRLSGRESVRFALVAAGMATTVDQAPIELLLASGDRLRIPPGADAATLRTVLNVRGNVHDASAGQRAGILRILRKTISDSLLKAITVLR